MMENRLACEQKNFSVNLQYKEFLLGIVLFPEINEYRSVFALIYLKTNKNINRQEDKVYKNNAMKKIF